MAELFCLLLLMVRLSNRYPNVATTNGRFVIASKAVSIWEKGSRFTGEIQTMGSSVYQRSWLYMPVVLIR